MRLVSLIGSNATGKSTRMTRLTQHLGDEYTPIIVEGKEQGRLYTKYKTAVIGRMGKNGKWNSMDGFTLTSWETRLKFFKNLAEDSEIETVFIEGFFNMCTKAGSPNGFHAIGYDKVQMLFMTYDTVEEYLARINERNAGKVQKDMEWAKNAPGWRDNEGRIKNFFNYFTENSSPIDEVIKVDYRVSEDFLISYL